MNLKTFASQQLRLSRTVGVVAVSTTAVIVAVIVGVVVVANIMNMAVYVGAVGIIGIGPVAAVV